jgi:microcystin-dependent protein
MTVTTTANSIRYAGNGTTKAFAFPYIFFAPTDLLVELVIDATGAFVVPSPILNGGGTFDYTVLGTVTNGEYASGATVTFNTAPPTGRTVSLVRSVPAIQTVALVDNAKFPAETVNTEFDYLTVLIQQALSAAGGGDIVTGPITSIIAGIGLSGGGNAGAVSIDLEPNAPGVVPIGGIVDFAGSVAPANWLVCQGQALATAGIYNALFGVIGFTYGGGGGSFNLPDLGGRVTAGKEATATRLTTAGSGIDGATLAAAGGLQTHVLTLAQSPAHSHTTTLAASNNTPNVVNTGQVAWGNGDNMSTTYQPVSSTVGGGAAHLNTQPTMVLNKIIRYA